MPLPLTLVHCIGSRRNHTFKRAGTNHGVSWAIKLHLQKCNVCGLDVANISWNCVDKVQDPKNGQYVLCDPTLQALTGRKKIKGFGIQGLVRKHFLDGI